MLGIAGISLACSLAVDVRLSRDAGFEPRESSCELRFFRRADGLGEDCELLAEVELRDTGFTINCGSDRVREEVRAAGCEIGGDTAVLQRIIGPSSTCVQTDAKIYRCAQNESEQP